MCIRDSTDEPVGHDPGLAPSQVGQDRVGLVARVPVVDAYRERMADQQEFHQRRTLASRGQGTTFGA